MESVETPTFARQLTERLSGRITGNFNPLQNVNSPARHRHVVPLRGSISSADPVNS